MAEFPALPLFTDAYLGDTTHLTTLEHGAYLLLLITMWRTKNISLPGDDRLLARYTKLTSTQWKRVRPILEPFFDIDEKSMTWTQGRLTDEAAHVRQHSKLQSDRAKGRHLKNKETSLPRHSRGTAPTPTPTIDISKDISIPHTPSAPEIAMHFENIWNKYPGRGKNGATGAGFKGDKKTARLKFETIYKNTKEADRETLVRNIIAGCGEYAQFIERADYPSKHLSTWLNAAGWETDYGVSAPAQADARRGGEGYLETIHAKAMADQTHRHIRERGGDQGSGMGIDPGNIRGGSVLADTDDGTLSQG